MVPIMHGSPVLYLDELRHMGIQGRLVGHGMQQVLKKNMHLIITIIIINNNNNNKFLTKLISTNTINGQ